MHRLLAGIFPVLLVVVGLPPDSVSGQKIHMTHLGTLCTGSCTDTGGVYQCKSINKYGQQVTMYCSPLRSQDYYGRQCITPCGKHGYDYYWCKAGDNWGYCGLDNLNYLSVNYQKICNTHCKRESYSWCETDGGWDYCSLRPEEDYYGNECRLDSPCADYGKGYTWCYLKKGGWGYCGVVQVKPLLHTSSGYRSQCVNECGFHGKGYFWCYAPEGWDYCSPLHDRTKTGEQCQKSFLLPSCSLNSRSYYWCYTESSWDYCGPVEASECKEGTPFMVAGKIPALICKTKTKKEKKFKLNGNKEVAKPNNKERQAAMDMIEDKVDGKCLDDGKKKTLYKDKLIRLDREGIVTRDGVKYANLQIQLNVSRRPGQDTTIAQVLVPLDSNIEDVKEALLLSLLSGEGIDLVLE